MNTTYDSFEGETYKVQHLVKPIGSNYPNAFAKNEIQGDVQTKVKPKARKPEP